MSVDRLLDTVASGPFVVVLGVLIRRRGIVGLIAGYDPDEVTDEDGLANFVGSLTVLTGGATIPTGVLDNQGVVDGLLWYGFGAFVGRVVAC